MGYVSFREGILGAFPFADVGSEKTRWGPEHVWKLSYTKPGCNLLRLKQKNKIKIKKKQKPDM